MNKGKAIIVTGLIFVLLCILVADVVALFPGALLWILGVLAVPGAWLFCKIMYVWLTSEDAPFPWLKVPEHKKRKKGKNGVDWTRIWAGVEGVDK